MGRINQKEMRMVRPTLGPLKSPKVALSRPKSLKVALSYGDLRSQSRPMVKDGED